MAEPARRRATYEDIIALPEGINGELLGGELHTQPRPAGPHGIVAAELGVEIGTEFGPRRRDRGPGEWIFIPEPELHLGEDVLVPDIAGWKVERLPLHERTRAAFRVAPDWICEILSPSTLRRDREIKAPLYAGYGVAHMWFVDPRVGAIEAFARHDADWQPLGTWSGAEARIPPYDAAALDLPSLWALIHEQTSEPSAP